MDSVKDILLTLLVNSVWQSSVVAAVALLLARLFRTASARVQHCYWVAVLLIAVLGPVAGYLYTTERVLPAETATAAEALRLPAPVVHLPQTTDLFAGMVLGAYFMLLAFGAVRVIKAWRSTWRLMEDAHTVLMPERVLAVWERCLAHYGLPLIPIVYSEDCAGPLTAGALRPIIAIPQAMVDEASEPVLATMLSHEMAHIRRRDYLFNLFYELVSLPVWFLPGVRLIKHNIERSRELACDEIAAPQVTPRAYAASLVEVAALLTAARRPGYTLGALDGNVLEERVRRLLQAGRRGLRPIALFALPAFAAMAAACVLGAVLVNGGSGTLTGVVRDPTGAVVAETAQVTVRNVSTGELRKARTDPVGVFEFRQLPAGRYDVSVGCRGFVLYRKRAITVGAIASPRLDVELRLGRVSETLNVRAS
jgi:beta-lactamase regulating signal transducer with metallopeptidase domain